MPDVSEVSINLRASARDAHSFRYSCFQQGTKIEPEGLSIESPCLAKPRSCIDSNNYAVCNIIEKAGSVALWQLPVLFS